MDTPPLPPDLAAKQEEFLPKLPSHENLYLRVPLYRIFPFTNTQTWGVYGLVWPEAKNTVDCFCVQCGSHSVFHPREIDPKYKAVALTVSFAGAPQTYAVVLECSRNADHRIYIVLLVGNNRLTKIGQSPSLADLADPDIRIYRKVLGDDRFREFSRAVGLTAHGIGIGAFVYLRRIFESLMEQVFLEARDAGEVTEEQYRTTRVEDKIDMLKGRLPEFMVKNSHLYGIVSKGVHELTEEECLAYFPTVKMGIEVILDQRMEEDKRRKKMEEAEREIGKLNRQLKKKE
jgi:hypothetical protein